MRPINGRVFLKLENESVRRTVSGIVYDLGLREKSDDTAFGRVYIINEEESVKHGLKVGDRVVFEKDRCDQIVYKAKVSGAYIDVILISIYADDIMCIVPEEKSVMDYIGNG